jgi:hypothetical protein
VAETLTFAAWFVATGGLGVEVYYRGHMIAFFRHVEIISYICLFMVVLTSFLLRESDPLLSKAGLATFFGVFILIAVFRCL